MSEKQKTGVVEEEKKLSSLIKGSFSQSESFLKQWEKVRYWSEDESRIWLHTIQRRKLTGRGIKPKPHVQVQWDFIYLWLYGAVKPLTGEGFFLRVYASRYSMLREIFRAICQ